MVQQCQSSGIILSTIIQHISKTRQYFKIKITCRFVELSNFFFFLRKTERSYKLYFQRMLTNKYREFRSFCKKKKNVSFDF